MYVLALLATVWATTTIKPLRKGWKHLDSNSRSVILTKISLALALIGASVVFFFKS